MTELKTLKDLEENGLLNGYTHGEFSLVHVPKLKAEAVKWVKAIRQSRKDNYDLPRGKCVDIGELKDVEVDWEESSEMYGMEKILIYFFNLTEEDLK